MPPRHEDNMCDATPGNHGRFRRLSYNLNRITPRKSLRKMFPRSKSAKGSVLTFPTEQLTNDPSSEQYSNEHHLLPKDLSPNSRPTMPITEVTVIQDQSMDVLKPAYSVSGNRIEIIEAECNEYKVQLKNTQAVVDQLTTDLNKSQTQVTTLINQNTMLLDELKAMSGKDDASLDTNRMLRQELTIMKGCLFLSAMFIFFGGRPDFVGLMSLMWLVVDVST